MSSPSDKNARPFPLIRCGAEVLEGAGFHAIAENVRLASTAIGYSLQAVLLARQQFEGNPEGALDEIEHRVRSLLSDPAPSHAREPVRQVDKQVTLQASEYKGLVYNARRYEYLRDNMRRMPLGDAGTRHFFDQPGTMSFQEAVDVAMEKP